MSIFSNMVQELEKIINLPRQILNEIIKIAKEVQADEQLYVLCNIESKTRNLKYMELLIKSLREWKEAQLMMFCCKRDRNRNILPESESLYQTAKELGSPAFEWIFRSGETNGWSRFDGSSIEETWETMKEETIDGYTKASVERIMGIFYKKPELHLGISTGFNVLTEWSENLQKKQLLQNDSDSDSNGGVDDNEGHSGRTERPRKNTLSMSER